MWAQKNTNKKVIAWDGFCHVHDRICKGRCAESKKGISNALLMAHPGQIEVLELADHVTSTSGMLRFAKASDAGNLLSEQRRIIHRLKRKILIKYFILLERHGMP